MIKGQIKAINSSLCGYERVSFSIKKKMKNSRMWLSFSFPAVCSIQYVCSVYRELYSNIVCRIHKCQKSCTPWRCKLASASCASIVCPLTNTCSVSKTRYMWGAILAKVRKVYVTLPSHAIPEFVHQTHPRRSDPQLHTSCFVVFLKRNCIQRKEPCIKQKKHVTEGDLISQNKRRHLFEVSSKIALNLHWINNFKLFRSLLSGKMKISPVYLHKCQK